MTQQHKQVQPGRKQLITLIHVAKSQLHMDDDSYRAHLKFYGQGKVSSAQMTLGELQAVYEAFKPLGFKPSLKQPSNGIKRYSPSTEQGPQDQRSAIRAVWVFMFTQGFIEDGSETALNAWVQRMSAPMNDGQGIAEVQWLQNVVADKLLNSLKLWCRRCMFQALRSSGYDIHPQASYTQVRSSYGKHMEHNA
ncbi:regulatory protein GemA [Rheinheimera sp.]|uniref:gp16 family protein n=1 Tax=Rheinheimera sp. TaxID=1869214 RepID=UPI00307DFE74